MAIIQPLDLKEILVHKLAGSGTVGITIFLFLSLVVIAVMASKFRMPGGAFIVVLVAFILLMSSVFTAGTGLIFASLVLITLGLSWMIAKGLNIG